MKKKLKIGYYLIRLAIALVAMFFCGYAYTTFLEVI